MDKLSKLIEEMNLISNRLSQLENEFMECHEDFSGNEFDDQNKCVSAIENLVLMLTYEVSSEIQLGVEELKMCIKYLDFRKSFNDYSYDELLIIIDKNDNLNIVQKKKIIEEKKEKNLTKITSEWNRIFNNKSYFEITKRIRTE